MAADAQEKLVAPRPHKPLGKRKKRQRKPKREPKAKEG
jgi:hypothetical protein